MRIPGAPVGYRFRPSCEQVIEYLLNKVKGNTLPSVIFDRDLYGEDEVWKSLFSETNASELYFCTKLLKKKKKDGKRVVRKVGTNGTWRSNRDEQVFSQGVHIGSKRCFSYQEKEKSAVGGLGFVMDEYRLDGVLGGHPEASEVVICCVRKKLDKKMGKSNRYRL